MKLSANVASLGWSFEIVDSNFQEGEPLEFLEELKPRLLAIGNLLNDDVRMEIGGDDNYINVSDLVNGGNSNGSKRGLNSIFASDSPDAKSATFRYIGRGHYLDAILAVFGSVILEGIDMLSI